MNDRTTSAAKHYIEQRAGDILEQYGIVKGEFDKVRGQEQVASQDQQNDQDGQGSQMVSNDQPKLENRPPPEIARPVDRESFNDRWTQEQERAGRDVDRSRDLER